VTSDQLKFCLDNTGDIPLTITANIPEDVGASSLDWNKVSLAFSCKGGDETITKTVADLHASAWAFQDALANGSHWNCNVTATADSTVTGGSLNPFTINFVGTQVPAI
jgi:hypothetical protein